MNQQIELKKSITWIKGSALTIGAVLGAGILVLPAIAAEIAGPASILSWILMGLFSLPMVITIGMMSSRFPDSGGMASYSRQAFGSFGGRLTGLLILSAMPLGMPITALIGANYLGGVFLWPTFLIHMVAALLLVLAIILNYRGVELSGRIQVLVISIILLILIFTVVFSAQHVNMSNFHHFTSNSYSWIHIGQAMNLIFFAFMGWEMIGHLAEEFYNPRKDIPLSLAIGFLFINFIYIGIAFVVIGNQAYQTNNPATAMIDLVAYSMGNNASIIVAFLGLLICYCTVHTYIAGFSRLVYSQSRDGYLPPSFGKLHPRHQTPHVALLFFIPLFIIILFLSYHFSWNLKSLIGIPSTTFLAVYIISMLAAANVLPTKIGKISAYMSAFLSSIVFLFAGWSILYPLTGSMLVFCLKKKKKATF
ncbi:MAG TPA: amino acid permease [Ignavibacteria bacterium]